jgi:hypothetical protein
LDQHFRPNGGCFLGVPPPLPIPVPARETRAGAVPLGALAHPHTCVYGARVILGSLWGRHRVV